jgi:hypothetical protein
MWTQRTVFIKPIEQYVFLPSKWLKQQRLWHIREDYGSADPTDVFPAFLEPLQQLSG